MSQYGDWSDNLYADSIEALSVDGEALKSYDYTENLFSNKDLAVLSGHPRFTLGFSGSTWWGRDKDGEEWVAAEEGRTVQWYRVQESGAKLRYGPMTYSNFKELFNPTTGGLL